MHIGKDGSKSKTEAVIFAAPGKTYEEYDTTPVNVDEGYITYTTQFKYLGSIFSWNLDDRPDLENRALQARKAFQAMLPKVFRNSSISLKVKRMLYMAIPLNLLLWGCESWALKDSDWKFLQVFHTSSICRILNINMVEVQTQHITNEQVYSHFTIDSIKSIFVSRQLRWIGKIAMMEESCLPRKFLNAWHPKPRPVGRPLTTIRHTYLHALWYIKEIPENDDKGKLNDWLPAIRQDPNAWETRRLRLTPNIVGYIPTVDSTAHLNFT